jgi:hypothetical protein
MRFRSLISTQFEQFVQFAISVFFAFENRVLSNERGTIAGASLELNVLDGSLISRPTTIDLESNLLLWLAPSSA